MKTANPYHPFAFSFATSYAQIEISTSLQEAVHKAIDKNSSIKNKELEIENFSFRKRVFGTNTYQLLQMHFTPILTIKQR
jgi:hypothetical protein